MKALFHSLRRLSMHALLCLGGAALAGPALAVGTSSSPYFGRWIVDEEKPVFTARGKLYKTIDVAPCGRDFCGVSVDDSGKCGATLFRFLSKRLDGAEALRGHGKWGTAKKNVLIYAGEDSSLPNGRYFELYLGDGYDFGERSDNIPKFHANYRPSGGAKCSAR